MHLDESPDLTIARSCNRLVLALAEFFGQVFEAHVLVDRPHRWTDRSGVERADQVLQGWMHRPLPMIGGIGDTGDLPKVTVRRTKRERLEVAMP